MNRIRDSKQYVVRLGLIAILASVCTLVPSASGQTMPEALPAGASANVWFAGGEAIVETPQLEQIVPTTSLAPTPWGTPVQVSPRNGTALFHYPRTTTLVWQPVDTATSYVVEAAYLSGSSWTSYPPVTVTGNSNSFYTFNCFAAHQGQSDIRADSLRSTGFPHAASELQWIFHSEPVYG